MSKKEFIDTLSTKRATYSDSDQAEMAANLLDTVSSDIYSESQRFIFELIQNADDAARRETNEVRFDFLPHHLLVSHNGSAFTPEDIEAITGAGFSRKKNDPTKTGYKGIGFKSVFGKSNWVGIFSDGYNLRFEKDFHTTRLPWQVIPIWTEPHTLPAEVQRFLAANAYRVTTVIQLPTSETLEQELAELLQNGQILLFLRHVTTITVAKQGQVQYTIAKTLEPGTPAYQPTTLWKDNKAVSNWLVQHFDHLPVDTDTQQALQKDEKTPGKLRNATHTELAFAARVESGRIRSLKDEESLLFTYLPTKVADFNFPFLVNGSFLTSAAREALHEDRLWNQWLLGLVAEKLFEWLAQLAGTEHRFEVLHLLPSLFPGSSNELKKAFARHAQQALATRAFVPTQSQALALASDTLIDDTGLASQPFISREALAAFVNGKNSSHFTSDSFAHTDLQRSRKLQPLGATLFEAANLEGFFLSTEFTDSHELDQNYALLEYFFRKATKFDPSGEWNHKLKLIPFLYSAEKQLKAPAAICFPSIAYKTEAGQTVTVIHPTVYAKLNQHADLKTWLESLGVKEPSDEAYLENEILGNIEKCITKENYQEITRYLFTQFKKGRLTPKQLEGLHELQLLCASSKLTLAKECYLADMYEPVLKLQDRNKLGEFVSPDYKQANDLVSEWKSFFIKIGVSENISLVNIIGKKDVTKSVAAEYFDIVGQEAKRGHGWPHLVGADNRVYFDRITYCQFAVNYQFSKLFWEQAFAHINVADAQSHARMPWGYYGSYEHVTNYFHWFLDNQPVFPTSQRTCRKAAEVFTNQKDIANLAGAHLPVFDYDEAIPDAWRPLLKFRQRLEVADYLQVLASIAQAASEHSGTISDAERRRIGLVYTQLAQRVPDLTGTEKAAITVWSRTHSLLATSDNFEPAAELKWITQDGFQSVAGGFKALYIPANCQTDTPGFSQLLELLQVRCISEFIPLIEGRQPNPALKSKLLEILPYLALIVHKRQYKSAEAEYYRMRKLVEATSFYSATAICLTFTDQGETHRGQPLPVFRDAVSNLFLKGSWLHPLTSYHLLRELGTMLEVKSLEEEVRLLLMLPLTEIDQWLRDDIGVTAENLAAAYKWLPELPVAAPQLAVDASTATSDSVAAFSEFDAIDEEAWTEDVFTPIVMATALNPANITIEHRSPATPTSDNGQSAAGNTVHGTIQNQATRLDIGRWCEELVNSILKANTTDFSQVQWLNQQAESSQPYDIKVLKNGQPHFIEVKGTPSQVKGTVYLSVAEWRLMFEQGPAYSIYRVYGAGTPEAHVVVFDYPSDLIKQGGLLPVTIELHL